MPALALAQQPVNLKIDATQAVREIDPKIYGQFLEHIYHSVNGGIWGEVVWNRSFEERLSADDWRVEAGILKAPAATHESRFLIGPETWTDYDFFVDIRKTGGDGSLAVGVRGSRANGLTMSFDGKQAQLIRTVGNRQTRSTDKSTLATAELPLENGRWYRVHLRAGGRRLQAFVDDKQIFDVKTEAGTDAGQAFLVVRSAAGEFRGLRAVALDHTVLFDSLPSPARHWNAIGAGELSLDADQPFNSKLSLKISGSPGAGVAQDNFAVRRGDALRGSLWVRGESAGGVSVRLMSGRYVLAQSSLPPPSGTGSNIRLLSTRRKTPLTQLSKS